MEVSDVWYHGIIWCSFELVPYFGILVSGSLQGLVCMMKGVVVDCDGSKASVIHGAWCTRRGRLYEVLWPQFCLYFFYGHGLLVCHFCLFYMYFGGCFLF